MGNVSSTTTGCSTDDDAFQPSDWSLTQVLVFLGFVNNIKALTDQDDVLVQLLEVSRIPHIKS